MKSAFLPSKGLLCLCDKQNNTWLLVDMEFLFSCSTRHLTHSLRSLVSYRVKYSKRNSISTRAHVLFSINLRPNSIVYLHFLRLILSAHPSRGNDFKTMRHNFSITWLEWKWNLKFEEVINRLLKWTLCAIIWPLHGPSFIHLKLFTHLKCLVRIIVARDYNRFIVYSASFIELNW